MTQPASLLEVRDLAVDFPLGKGKTLQAVQDVSLHVGVGETVGLVGESGSGKSTLGNAILGLVKPSAGAIVFAGRHVTHLPARSRRELARRIQVVFQDPYRSLNPSRTVGHTLAEPLRMHGRLSRADAGTRVTWVLERVGLPADAARRYPAQFSGGQRQRIAIARALVLEPELIICDEPTSALDLSIQAQILNLLLDLQQELGLAYLFVSHDIDVVRHIAHRVAVMLKGRIVEEGTAETVTTKPTHPYTQALLASVPVPDPDEQLRRRERRLALGGPAVGPASVTGCPYADRCPSAIEVCAETFPALAVLPSSGSSVACHVHGLERIQPRGDERESRISAVSA